jgi:hypothetical protein
VENNGELYGELIGNHLLRKSNKDEQKRSIGLLLQQSGKIGDACEAMQREVLHLSKNYV